MPLVGLFSIVCVFCMHQSSLLRLVCLYLATISIVFALYMHQSSFLSLICLDLNLLSVGFAIYIATKLFCTHLIHLVRATFPIEYAFYIHQSSLFHLDEFSWPRSLLNMTSVCIIAILPLFGHDLHCICLVYIPKLFCTPYTLVVGHNLQCGTLLCASQLFSTP